MWKNNTKQYRENVNKNLNTHGLIDFKDKGKKRTYYNEFFYFKIFFSESDTQIQNKPQDLQKEMMIEVDQGVIF
jgi:hypothetical protein